MDKIRYKIMNFMQGRYGNDGLNVALIILYMAVGFIRLFFRSSKTAGIIISVIMFLILGYTVFRMLSKNIAARQNEYFAFKRLTGKLSPHFILLKNRIRDIKTKRYRRCPHCKNVLRLPYKKGKHNVHCPKCGKDFSVHII